MSEQNNNRFPDLLTNKYFRDVARKSIKEAKGIFEETEIQKRYRGFFKEMLEIFGVNSPSELGEEHRGQFFNMIRMGWDSETKEVDEFAINVARDYVEQHDLVEEEMSLDEMLNSSDDNWNQVVDVFHHYANEMQEKKGYTVRESVQELIEKAYNSNNNK